jgi:hypothetical protein
MQEHEEVVLEVDLPEYGLTKGDIGTIVLVHGEHEGYEVEFMTLHGETIAVVTLLPSHVRPISSHEIAHARTLERVPA